MPVSPRLKAFQAVKMTQPLNHPEYGEMVGFDPLKKRYAYSKPVWVDGELYDNLTVVYDISDTLEMNHHKRMESQGRKMGDTPQVSSIPPAILYGTDLNRAHNEGDEKYVRKWLNENWKFKTTDKRL